MRIGDVNNINQYTTMMAKQTKVPSGASKTANAPAPQAEIINDSVTLSENRMGLEQFKELINSDMPMSEKIVKFREAFGDIQTEEALRISIQNVKNGKMSIEEMYQRCNDRAESQKISINEAYKLFMETAPGNDEVERSKALSAKFIPIQAKMRMGKSLTAEEKGFIREHYPELYAQAMQIEQEVQALKAKLQASGSKEESQRIYMDAKMMAMSAGKDSGIMLCLMPAIDEVYRSNAN